jgi:hypothetical protein
MFGKSHIPRFSSRREFLAAAGGGFGALAFAAMAHTQDKTSPRPDPANPLALQQSPFAPKADRVLFLFMEGGPSQVDLFDPKPELTKRHGQPLPASFGKVITPMGTGSNKLLASKRKFHKCGQSEIEMSDWLPFMSQCADDFAVVRSCQADGLNHVGSVCQMNTGSILAGRPSLGSWVTYGLGSPNQNLPGFVVLTDSGEVTGGPRNWGTGFMPATYQGTLFRSGAKPILDLDPPDGVSAERQRDKLKLIRELDDIHRQARPDDLQLSARLNSYELAFRMQAYAPEAVDLAQESEATKRAYGFDRKECADYAHRCLLARRLLERNVRFVQVYCGAGSQWDAHSDLEGNHTRLCARMDQPTAALLKDLKQRGLLERTLVVWGGEFGRTPMTEGTNGRDHDPYGFTMLFAGGGVKGGRVIGRTDEFGLRAVEDHAHVHDLHATILYALGLDHLGLTYFHNGRHERLTIDAGHVINKLFS